MTTYTSTEIWIVKKAKNIDEFVDMYFGENPSNLPAKELIIHGIRLWHYRGNRATKNRIDRVKQQYDDCMIGNSRAKQIAHNIMATKKLKR